MSTKTKTKTRLERSLILAQNRQWQVMFLLCLLVLLSGTATANELFNKSRYTMSSSTDHLTFNILLGDLRGRDDWVTEGYVKAYSQEGRKGNCYTLFNVWTVDQDNTSEHRIYGKIEQSGALAKITNLNRGVDHLTDGNDKSWIKIEDSKHNYPTVHIDFYWAPELSGKTWYFYFEGMSDEYDKLTYYLGSASCSSDMGRPSMDVKAYSCSRRNSKQLEFSIPGKPEGSAVPDYQWHEGWYDVTFTYNLYSGGKVTKTHKFVCEPGLRKNYPVDIPTDVGNFRSLDMAVTATDAYKNKNGDYYYKRQTNYKHTGVLPSVPTPNNIAAEYRQFDAKIDLSWSSVNTGVTNYIGKSVPYIYRVETDKEGKPISGQNWKKLRTLKEVGTNKSYTYSDNGGIQPNTYYKYMVVNVPTAWINANDIATADLNSPADAFSSILNRVGSVETAVVSTNPSVDIFSFAQDTTVTDKVALQWKYSRVPGVSGNVTFDIWRAPTSTNNWNKIGSSTAKANPDAGTVGTFTDADLANEKVRYDYKVQLSINSEKNVFESDVLTAGLLKGTSLKDFTATKGTHDNSVLLQWTAHQAGTDNTNYDIYRRYVGDENSDWMKTYSVSGHSDSYTYEDKTVRPGYYYEYKIEAYSGEKASDSTPISSLTSTGFCQARGVVSGRVSFSTGNMAVEDVRVTLRSADEGDNAIRGYSQRIDGASTGIVWEADSAAITKLFGPSKDYTVQMFVRPDSLLSEGAVFGEIPGEGRLVLGNMSNGEYDLLYGKVTWGEPEWVPPVMTENIVDLSKLTGDYVAQNGDVLTGNLGGEYKISIADGATVKLKDVTIYGNLDWTDSSDRKCEWAGITCPGDATLVLEGEKNYIRGFKKGYPAIYIAEGKTLTVKGHGKIFLYSSLNDAPGIGSTDSQSCGNIVIECGDLTVWGGGNSAAIGSGNGMNCGNITIKGGIVNVLGGTRGLPSIGAYGGGKCGTVTIGGTKYWDGEKYLNVGEGIIGIYQYKYTNKEEWDNDLSNSDPVFTHVAEEGYSIYPRNYDNIATTGVKLAANTYSLLTVSRTGDNLQFQVGDSISKTLTANKSARFLPFSVGGASDVTDEQAFHGNLTEVRVWDHILTDKERTIYADRVLSGREQGLKLYWPMDEGKNRLVFDASYSNDVPNGRHATVGPNISSSIIIPEEEQLSRYGLTNASGEYTIRGIPFVGSGTTYTFTPTKGIHTFSPAQRNGFIGPTSLALNNTDFGDDSSFPMRGKVTYLNTNIPVDSVQFKIDGTVAQSNSGPLVSDNKGEYEISVPIGSHRIEAWKDGHCLTAFPKEPGQTHDFMKAETVNFVDSTLVNVTGRINGGFTDKDEPLGFRRSTNRIGQATIKLSLGLESECSFNYITNDRGESDFGTTPLPVASATDAIASKAWRAAAAVPDGEPSGSLDNSKTHYIYIKTDSVTGEFSALLPPLRYKVESITFDNDEKGDNARYNNLDFFTQNLPIIDATITNEKEMPCDSLTTEGGNKQCYYYSGKMVRQLRNNPTLTVVQDDMKNGAFGMNSLKVSNVDGTTEDVPVTTYTADGYTYNYGYPLFQQNETYDMTISLKEQYVNVDTKETVTEIPADATIHVSNEGSISTAVIAEKCELNGKELLPGEVYTVSSIEATPDQNGVVQYSWIAGMPNLADKHLRTLTISANVDGRTHVWKPDGKNDGLDFVALGGIITGTNFVTGGPDHVDMILRRPPGSTGYATWTVDTIHSNYSSTMTYDSHSGGGGIYANIFPSFKAAAGNVLFWKVTEIKVEANHTVTRANISEDTKLLKEVNSYTISETKTTPSASTYTQRDGDTFIGRATNLLFGKGEAIGLFKQSDGTYKIDQQETICAGEQFSTTFIYPHQYIEDVLIPNWEKLIDGFLTHYDGDLKNAPKESGKMMYYTKYNKGDAAWGKANSDTEFWTEEQIKQAQGEPGYHVVNGLEGDALKNSCDSVEWCANQIRTWKYWLSKNEEDKVDAFTSEGYLDKNYSIAGGTSVSQTTKNTTEKSKGGTVKTAVSVNNESHAGALFNGLGAYAIMKFNDSWGTTKDSLSTDATTKTFSWRLSDNEPTTALSVDVYKSPNGWGPIFRTRGGQSSNPYEGATYTKYYNPGTQLDEATMRVEKPELRVDGPTEITDVPTGGTAKFTLELYNASETNSICTYVLETKENSNPNGAVLTIDGTPVSNGKNGRTVKMKGGETITKQLLVKQSDRSVVDYEDITLVLKSVNDTATVSNPVKLRVHFVPASALVDIAVDHTVLNNELYYKNQGVIVTLKNLNRQDDGLAGLRVRYRRKGIDSWTLAKEWRVNAQGDETPLPDTQTITTAVKFPDDGLYELQAQTFGMYGTEEVTYETEKIEVMQDTHGPKILGMVSPENGQLNYLNRNNMHLRFNEEMNGNALSKSDNFRIEGGMNNVVFGESPYPDVAVQLNGNSIETDALYDMPESDYAFDLWFYRQGDGTIVSMGTENNLLALSTHDDGKLQARVGGKDDVFETGAELPKDKWMYMALNYRRKTAADQDNTITMLYVTADDIRPNYVGKNQPAKDFDGHGKLAIGGDGMTGMIAGLSIWNNDVTADQLYETRNLQRAAYTPGLVGYWKMDEGHGTQVTDKARSRNMYMESESWYINNENRAAHLDGTEGSPLKVDVATFNPTKTDNFAYEMWFRGNKADNDSVATLMSVDNSAKSKTAICFDQGKLKLKVTNDSITLSDKNYLDGSWHHLALNVRRGTSAIAYIDGQAVKVLPEASVPGISSHYLVVGGELNDTTEVKRFTGDVDEIRIWSAALDGQLISDRMYERMDNSYPGLVGYFPMEDIHRTEQGNVVTDFSIDNFGESTSLLTMMKDAFFVDGVKVPVNINQAVNAPALKPGSTNLRLDDSQFNFTASANEIYFSFPDAVLPQMDGNDFVASVNYIKDEHGNNSETVSWMFHTDFASLKWSDDETVVSKAWNEATEWQTYVINQTGTAQSYELSGMPTWLTVDKTIGTITGEGGYISFRLGTDVPVGRHTEYIYLTDQLGIRRVLKLNLTVTGNVPNWTVDPDLYESNMTLTGQIYINDKICENSDTQIAAFDSLGLCRGVASPKYVRTRDAYYVDMVIYGASATKLSDGTRDLTFKVYDASTGTIYPLVGLLIPNKPLILTMQYKPDANYGSYDAPVKIDVANALEQKRTLARGWTWMSIYVNPLIDSLAFQLPKDKNILKRFKIIKSQFGFSTVNLNGEIQGEVATLEPGKMYKMQLETKTDFDIIGMALDVKNLPQTIHPGYNWIGPLTSSVMSVDEAFAELAPEPGDRVKSRTAFAEFSNKGYWEGTLESIVRGQGYIYHSKAAKEKSFHYPSVKAATALAREFTDDSERRASTPTHFTPVDPYLYPDNLSIIAVVKKDGQERDDAEVAAIIEGECRGAIGCNKGHYFLTVMGSSEEDSQKKMELRVYIDGEEYTVDDSLPFISDAFYGSLDEPYVLDIDATAIRELSSSADDNDSDWWSIQGFKIGRKPTQPGVYIHHGKKVTIKRVK